MLRTSRPPFPVWEAMRRALAVGSLLLALLGGGAPAHAHGPCVCTEPQIALPGDELVSTNAYLVVWNPRREWFVGGAGSRSLASAHRQDAPSRVVMLRDRPPYPRRPRRARFRVPRDTPPGLYLVLIFDGSEGGAHATWDYVHVPDPPLSAGHGELHELLAAVGRVFPPL